MSLKLFIWIRLRIKRFLLREWLREQDRNVDAFVPKDDVPSEGLGCVRPVLPVIVQRRRSLVDSILTGTVLQTIFVTHRYLI
jgi:hypothetical protein